ncbi:uncharacterized protein BDR25DRAFT_356034 [Lindgomyces ingoldianus]|uniref:Uncharacterized protein n=1 Tax=Lindgomyces ingoldianus TaxID=673940 RepID=A0ACB6QS15_9PLEO|nr:uncharacterized protein BDR25DRAFT_356034 [Lindgomyces ingoldianus]KAF2469784.1 hypothetical protein BDR25DRAFT_356034 [Lindgomyces ingoldianus]
MSPRTKLISNFNWASCLFKYLGHFLTHPTLREFEDAAVERHELNNDKNYLILSRIEIEVEIWPMLSAFELKWVSFRTGLATLDLSSARRRQCHCIDLAGDFIAEELGENKQNGSWRGRSCIINYHSIRPITGRGVLYSYQGLGIDEMNIGCETDMKFVSALPLNSTIISFSLLSIGHFKRWLRQNDNIPNFNAPLNSGNVALVCCVVNYCAAFVTDCIDVETSPQKEVDSSNSALCSDTNEIYTLRYCISERRTFCMSSNILSQVLDTHGIQEMAEIDDVEESDFDRGLCDFKYEIPHSPYREEVALDCKGSNSCKTSIEAWEVCSASNRTYYDSEK